MSTWSRPVDATRCHGDKKLADGTVDPAYLALFAPWNAAAGTGGYLCKKQATVVKKYGFGTLGTACGAQS